MQYGIMPRPNDTWSGSRDWYLQEIPCLCIKCHCNDGGGHCVVPSKIKLDYNGACITGKKSCSI